MQRIGIGEAMDLRGAAALEGSTACAYYSAVAARPV
jgi:hypothetical protein